MKTKFFPIALMFIVLSLGKYGSVLAQTCAVYWTSQGLAAEKSVAPEPGKPEFQTFEKLALRGKHLVAKQGALREAIAKDSVYGYRLRNQKNYRWDAAQQRALEIVEQKAIIIYRVNEPQYTSKGYVLRPVLYFSRQLDSKLWPLDVLSLKRAFPESYALQVQLDLLADPDAVAQWDRQAQCYKIQAWIAQYASPLCNVSQQ